MVLFRTTKEATDYVIKAEQGTDSPTTFHLRALPLRLCVWIMETVPKDFRSAFEVGIRAGVRWSNGQGELAQSKHETAGTAVCGQAVEEPLTAECFNAIPPDVAQELFGEVLAVNRLKKSDVGN